MEEANKPPTVGEPATLCFPQDRYPFVVIAVGKNAKQITLLPLKTDGLKPARECNGFPVFDSEVSTDQADFTRLPQKAYLRKNGQYYAGGIRMVLGRARYYRNHAD